MDFANERIRSSRSAMRVAWTILVALGISGSATAVVWAQSAMPGVPAAVPGGSVDTKEIQRRAIQQVVVSARSQRGDLRANAIEAAEALPDRRTILCDAGMRDPEAIVRFAALTVVGKMRLVNVAGGAQMLVNDPNDSVRAAALFALAMNFGTDRNRSPQAADITPLAGLIFSGDPGTRANIALLLGLIGDKTAIPLLKEAARINNPSVSQVQQRLVNLQIAEAVVKLGDAETIDAIRAGAFSQLDEVRVLAVSILGRLNDRRFEAAFLEMLQQDGPIELKVAAAGTLARFGRGEGYQVVIDASQNPAGTVRAQAAFTLGLFRNAPAMLRLSEMLNDQEEQVRIAAAAAILGGGRDGL